MKKNRKLLRKHIKRSHHSPTLSAYYTFSTQHTAVTLFFFFFFVRRSKESCFTRNITFAGSNIACVSTVRPHRYQGYFTNIGRKEKDENIFVCFSTFTIFLKFRKAVKICNASSILEWNSAVVSLESELSSNLRLFSHCDLRTHIFFFWFKEYRSVIWRRRKLVRVTANDLWWEISFGLVLFVRANVLLTTGPILGV